MAKLSKRNRAIREKVEAGKLYPVEEAVALLAELSAVKFKESVDVAVNLGVDPRKSDQNVRGASVLPHGTGKTVRVACLLKALKPKKRKKRAQTLSVSMTWPRRFRRVNSILT